MAVRWLAIMFLVGSGVSDSCNQPVVDSPAGKFAGIVVQSRNGRDIHSYLGIPYAKPPLGELRFKDPIMMPKLEGIYRATDDSVKCYQQNMNNINNKNVSTYVGSEDCLYLNVHVPKVNEKKALPVLFWIHGGGFSFGSKSNEWNGPEFLLDKDMILVTTNYRLGILGFLSTTDSVIPGNMGMKDQTMAMRWVQQNIASFGGDPNAVTVAGESAGGAAASLHTHSPLSKGLFHRAIAQSGTAYSSYAVKPPSVVKSDAENIANYLGCSLESKQLLKCLQKMPQEEIIEAGFTVSPEGMLMNIDFVPTLEGAWEGAFLTRESLMESATVPIMAGVTSVEGLALPGELEMNPHYKTVSQIFDNIGLIMPTLGYYWWLPNKDEITDNLVKFYFGDEGMTDDNLIPIIKYVSDIMPGYGTHLIGVREKGPLYLYMLSYRGQERLAFKYPKELEDGVAHGEDLLYLFNIKIFNDEKEWTKKDTEFSENILQFWFDFIKYGEPTPATKIWKESNKGINYLDMTNNGFFMKTDMFKERNDFLDKLNIDRLSQ